MTEPPSSRIRSSLKMKRKSLECIAPIVNDLQNASGSSHNSCHGIIILSKFVQHLLPPELICTINLNGVQYDSSASEIMRICEEMDFMIIQIIQNNIKNAKEVLGKIIEINDKHLRKRITGNAANTCLLIIVSLRLVELIFEDKFLDAETIKHILNVTQNNNNSEFDSSQSIADDFCSVINEALRNNEFPLILKESDTVFTPGSHTIMVMNGNLEIEPSTIEQKILPRMKTTQNRNKLIDSLIKQGYLYSTNKNRHPVSVYDENGKSRLIRTYSISCTILDRDNRYSVDNLTNQEYLLESSEIPASDFLPLIALPYGKTAGRQEIFSNEENNHMYVTGQSGFGKSYALSQIIYHSACAGHKVVIFDSSDSFTQKAVTRNISPEFLEHSVTFHSLEKDGIPVDLFSLDGITTLPQQKKLLAGVLSSATKDLSHIQLNSLKKVLSYILTSISPGEQIQPQDILDFFDEDDVTQKSLKNRFQSLFEDIESCGMSSETWETFIKASKNVIIISTQSAFTANGNQLIDMLLATLYNYQLRGTDFQLDIVVDEMQNQNFFDGSPIWKILREGRKYHIAFIGATQPYFQKSDPLGKVMNHAETLIFLKPKADSEKDVAAVLGFKKNETEKFRKMDRGDCIISSKFYSKQYGCNRPAVLSGKIYSKK